MSDLKKYEIQSPELQEIMSQIPESLFKWGLLILFILIFSLITGSYIIIDPEKVTVPVVITAQNPPINLIAKTEGEIDQQFVTEGSFIIKDDVVALIRNSCKYGDYKALIQFLSELNENSNWVQIVKTHNIPQNLTLGDIQINYSKFQKNWKQMKNYFEEDYIPTKLILLEKDMKTSMEYKAELIKHKSLFLEDISLSKNRFQEDSLLYYKNNNSISFKEFEKSYQDYIQKLYLIDIFNLSLKSTEYDFLRIKEAELDLRDKYKRKVNQYISDLEESIQLLKSTILIWEEKFLIKSSVSGNVFFSEFRHENQITKVDEEVATVIPQSPISLVAKAVIPISEFERIVIGQKVTVKVTNFPNMHYGILKGTISSLSQIAGDKEFSANILLSDGIVLTYKENISFIHQLDATAEINIKDRRLISNFLNPLKNVLKN